MRNYLLCRSQTMRKYSKSEKVIRQLIIRSEIIRLSLQDTALLLKDELGKDLSISYIADLRRKVREKGKTVYLSFIKEQGHLRFRISYAY